MGHEGQENDSPFPLPERCRRQAEASEERWKPLQLLYINPIHPAAILVDPTETKEMTLLSSWMLACAPSLCVEIQLLLSISHLDLFRMFPPGQCSRYGY